MINEKKAKRNRLQEKKTPGSKVIREMRVKEEEGEGVSHLIKRKKRCKSLYIQKKREMTPRGLTLSSLLRSSDVVFFKEA